MKILHSLSTDIPLFSTPNKETKHLNDSMAFDSLLHSSETEKTHAFILEHPELINEPLYPSTLTPIELSLSLTQTRNVRALINAGAHLNAPNAAGITPLDNMILMNDKALLQKIFGIVLGNIFHTTQEEVCSSHVSMPIIQEAHRQLQEIKSDINRYTDLSLFNDTCNPLINLIDTTEVSAVDQALLDSSISFSSKHIFDSLCYSILAHKNEAVESLYLRFGDEVLKLQTTDFKNLFHIAAIANNPEIIEKLTEWGLTVSSKTTIGESTLNIFSPFHYAIFNSTLNVFTALLKANIQVPPPAALLLDSQDVIFNPFQLLAFKANRSDPLPKESPFNNAYLLLEAANLFIEYTNVIPFPTQLTSILSIFRFAFLAGNMTKAFTQINYTEIPLASTLLTVSCAPLIHSTAPISTTILETLRTFSSHYKVIASTLMIKKVWDDFNRYQSAYLYRPSKTLWAFTKDMFINFLFVKSTFFDPNIDFKPLPPDIKDSSLSHLKQQIRKLHPQTHIWNCVQYKPTDKNTGPHESARILKEMLRCLINNNALDFRARDLFNLTTQEVKKVMRGSLMSAVNIDHCRNTWPGDLELHKQCEKISQIVSGFIS